jgi:hypothetical protein
VLPSLRPALLAPFRALIGDLPADSSQESLSAWFHFVLRHGFVEGLKVRGARAVDALLGNADAVFAATPLQHLQVSGHLSGPALAELLHLPQLSRLRRLDLLDMPLGPAGAALLVEARPRLHLHMLHLTGHRLPDEERAQLQAAYGPVLTLGPDYDEIPF